MRSLVSVARLLLSEGWDQLEGNTGIRVGTQAWEVIENFVVPVLIMIKGKDGRSMFTKVFGSTSSQFGIVIHEYRSVFTMPLEFLIQTVLSTSNINTMVVLLLQ